MGSRGDDRRRYILFRVHEGRPTRKAILEALRAIDPTYGAARVLDLDAEHGILQVPHRLQRDAAAAINGLSEVGGAPARFETVSASGTVRRVRRRTGQEP